MVQAGYVCEYSQEHEQGLDGKAEDQRKPNAAPPRAKDIKFAFILTFSNQAHDAPGNRCPQYSSIGLDMSLLHVHHERVLDYAYARAIGGMRSI